MPYINESARIELEECINNMVECLTNNNEVSNEEFTVLLGEINYCFSTILAKSMGETSYSKIAMITGVLENIKQEFYRRVASAYEDKKIIENGDIKQYGRQ